MVKWFTIFCLMSGMAYCAELPLLKRLEKAKCGDYVVFEGGKTVTLLAIRSLSKQSLVLEEISAPAGKVKAGSWTNWLQEKAPGHTSWSMVEIDLTSKQILECYSFSRCAWIPQSPEDSFLATLLHLPLNLVDLKERKRIGPPPLDGEPDRRQIWSPALMVGGKKVEKASFDVYEATWPSDESELAGKSICLYFDREAKSPLPCWIQIDTGQVSTSMRAIDSGHRLPPSFHRSLPRRIPEFIGSPLKTKNGIRLSVKSPKYYKAFELFAIDITSKEKQIHPITHSLAAGSGEVINFDIETEELNQSLQPDHKYTWLLVPAGFSSSYTELAKPFLWQ